MEEVGDAAAERGYIMRHWLRRDGKRIIEEMCHPCTPAPGKAINNKTHGGIPALLRRSVIASIWFWRLVSSAWRLGIVTVRRVFICP